MSRLQLQQLDPQDDPAVSFSGELTQHLRPRHITFQPIGPIAEAVNQYTCAPAVAESLFGDVMRLDD